MKITSTEWNKHMDTRIISLDIETYGAVKKGIRGNPLSKQTVFHPTRSMFTDKVGLTDLNITASITLVKEDKCEIQNELWTEQPKKLTKLRIKTQDTLLLPSTWQQQQSFPKLKNLKPQETMVFNLNNIKDRERLSKWLKHSEIIIGMNLPFDIQYLRKDPYFKFALEHQTLIDLSIINYLHDETREERSLKNLGPILRTHSYEKTIKEDRFSNPSDPLLYEYNAQDTHNTVLAIRELARRIERDFPDTSKLSSFCLEFYSNLLWVIIRMSESGICMDYAKLEEIETTLLEKCVSANDLSSEVGYPLQGEGSGKAKQDLIDTAIEEIIKSGGPDLRDNPLLQLTPAKGLISFTESNRKLIGNALSFPHELCIVFKCADDHAKAQKIVSSYTYPLLRHRRNKPGDASSRLIPVKNNHIAYPTWYAIPTAAKNSAGGEGGTLQGRITCKKPSAQTFPPQIKDCICSRFPNGKIISMDLSQIELRVAGLLSGDPAFIGAYKRGEDLHAKRALQIFGECDNKKRQVGKMVNFADLFRAGPEVIRKQVLAMSGIELDIGFCEMIVKSRKKHRPMLYAFQTDLILTAHLRGKIELPFTGQSRYFMGGDKYDENEIVNFPVQTTASNTLISIQSYIHKNMSSQNAPNPHSHMFLNIYDAIYFDVKDDTAEQEIKQIVVNAVNHVQNEGYWAMLSEYYENEIPLEYDWS